MVAGGGVPLLPRVGNRSPRRDREERILLGLLLFTGLAAVAGSGDPPSHARRWGRARRIPVRGPLSRELAAVYAVGLIGFEIAEWAWIGLQALEAVFGVLALAMLVLAFTSETVRRGARGDAVSSRDPSEATGFENQGR